MDDYENETEFFDSEQAKKIAYDVVQAVVGNENVVYSKEKVNDWCRQIIDLCIKELSKLNKEFKYAVTCIITQNNGCGLHTAATAFWEPKKDGLISAQFGSATFYCIVTIFAMAI